MLRLRQVVIAARDLQATVDQLSDFGLSVCFRDPGVAEFGLHNALLAAGDQLVEVVSPLTDGTAAGRQLDRRGADVAAYMVMFEVDDLDTRLTALDAAGVRTVWSGDLPTIRGRHLHPADVGGAIVSLDETHPWGSWFWAGPTWTAHRDNSVVTGVAGYEIAVDDPSSVAARWSKFGLLHGVRFVEGNTSTIDLVATDRSEVGHAVLIDQVKVRLV